MAEGIGTALLLATVVGSGIMGERLSHGELAMALLANSIATGCVLAGLIVVFASISGAHFNPAVTLAEAYERRVPWRVVPIYVLGQVGGAFAGVMVAHVMFGEPLLAASQHTRAGFAQLVSEFVATFGLVVVIWGSAWRRPAATPYLVGAYITGAYWFTSSTSFANPAVTLARAATNTFSGIRPDDVPGFVVAQLLGAAAAIALVRWLVPARTVAEGFVKTGQKLPSQDQHVQADEPMPVCPVVRQTCPFASGTSEGQPRVFSVRMLSAEELAAIDLPPDRR